MNATVAKMLGEADFHSPEERADLERHGGGEASPHSGEERKEVKLAQQIIDAVKAGEKQQVIKLAQQLIKMHRPQPGSREGIVGEISPEDFQAGYPFRLNRTSDPRDPYFRIKNARPLSKRMTLPSMMTGVPSQSFPSSP